MTTPLDPTSAPSYPDVGVVLVAAGAGTRTGSAELKQFRWIAGKPMLLHSLQAFQRHPAVGMVVCVLPRSHVADPPPWIFQSDIDRLLISVGGRERSDSVRNGLEDLPDEMRIVLIHDAARPFVELDVMDRVIEQARLGSVAVPGLRVPDTVKDVEPDFRVVRTLDRTRLWRAQTPQVFPREMIESAHLDASAAGIAATDDAALCERLGFPVVMVEGSQLLHKVTTEDDFAWLELLAAEVQ